MPQASFSTISIRPMPSSMIASPFMCGWWSRTMVATSPSSTGGLPLGISSGILARPAGVRLGRTWRMPSRWFGVSMKPPVPISWPLTCFSMPMSRASDVASMMPLMVALCWRILSASACTCSTFQRSPQMATLATPGTIISLGLTVQYAVSAVSMRFCVDLSLTVMPIFMTRLVEDSGWIMNGDVAQRGSWVVMAVTRSCTRSRASSRLVPGLKIMITSDMSLTERVRSTSSPGRPLSACSIGIVTSASTSAAGMPRHSTWTSTFGGANSG